MENLNQVEIEFIGDNPGDADFITSALNKIQLVNKMLHLKGSVEAMDFLFSKILIPQET